MGCSSRLAKVRSWRLGEVSPHLPSRGARPTYTRIFLIRAPAQAHILRTATPSLWVRAIRQVDRGSAGTAAAAPRFHTIAAGTRLLTSRFLITLLDNWSWALKAQQS